MIEVKIKNAHRKLWMPNSGSEIILWWGGCRCWTSDISAVGRQRVSRRFQCAAGCHGPALSDVAIERPGERIHSWQCSSPSLSCVVIPLLLQSVSVLLRVAIKVPLISALQSVVAKIIDLSEWDHQPFFRLCRILFKPFTIFLHFYRSFTMPPKMPQLSLRQSNYPLLVAL